MITDSLDLVVAMFRAGFRHEETFVTETAPKCIFPFFLSATAEIASEANPNL